MRNIMLGCVVFTMSVSSALADVQGTLLVKGYGYATPISFTAENADACHLQATLLAANLAATGNFSCMENGQMLVGGFCRAKGSAATDYSKEKVVTIYHPQMQGRKETSVRSYTGCAPWKSE